MYTRKFEEYARDPMPHIAADACLSHVDLRIGGTLLTRPSVPKKNKIAGFARPMQSVTGPRCTLVISVASRNIAFHVAVVAFAVFRSSKTTA